MSRLYDQLVSHRGDFGFRSGSDEIRNAQVVVADNVAEFFFAVSDQEVWDIRTDFPNLAPPFENMWVEARRPSRIVSGEVGTHSSAALPVSWGIFMGSDRNPDTNADPRWEWRVNYYVFAKLAGPFCPRPLFGGAYFVNKQGAVVDVGHSTLTALIGIEGGLTDHDLIAALDGILVRPLLLAISFMHCKNVEHRQVAQPPKLSKKWEKKHGRPLVRYHVLDIDPMRKVLRDEGGSEAHGLQRALHICRGHFATYTEDAPLFGRVVGTFWKPQHVRGSAKHGVVVKDYNVNASA